MESWDVMRSHPSGIVVTNAVWIKKIIIITTPSVKNSISVACVSTGIGTIMSVVLATLTHIRVPSTLITLAMLG